MADIEDDAIPEEEIPEELSIAVTPFVLGTRTYDVLTLNEPTTGMLMTSQKAARGLSGAEADFTFLRQLLSQISGWPTAAVDRLPVRKQREAMNYISRFLG